MLNPNAILDSKEATVDRDQQPKSPEGDKSEQVEQSEQTPEQSTEQSTEQSEQTTEQTEQTTETPKETEPEEGTGGKRRPVTRPCPLA